MKFFFEAIRILKHPVSRVSLAAFLVAAGALPFQAPAQSPPPRALLLKAGFIYNFIKFVQWPEAIRSQYANGHFRICIVGQDPIGPILDQLARTREVGGRSIQVQRNPMPSEFGRCQILFIPRSEGGRLESLLQAVQNHPILTVGDTPEFSKRGVGINLVIRGNRIRFEINRQALQSAGLKPSSELLDLAIIVDQEGGP